MQEQDSENDYAHGASLWRLQGLTSTGRDVAASSGKTQPGAFIVSVRLYSLLSLPGFRDSARTAGLELALRSIHRQAGVSSFESRKV